MNILMMTNTYKPMIGGLERSVEGFSEEYRRRGHRVVIVAPNCDEAPENEPGVVRVPAIQHFNGSDFSVQLPIPGALNMALGDFKPDLVHSHHPFLIGDAAVRVSYVHKVPLVFTHHTLYEQNTHYVPGDSEALKRFVIQLSTGYANLADQVFAPSESVVELLVERGVETPIEVMPTGVNVEAFATGDGRSFRQGLKIPESTFIVGTVGRLAPEKNLEFLSKAVLRFLSREAKACFMVVGEGPLEHRIWELFKLAGLQNRLYLCGKLEGRRLADAYAAMDVFAFASQSETQGMVLVEAMAGSVPVVAVDACGVRDVVSDGVNGCLLGEEDPEAFAEALARQASLPLKRRLLLKEAALRTAECFSLPRCAEKALKIYGTLTERKRERQPLDETPWSKAQSLIRAEWKILQNFTRAAGAVLSDSSH